MTLAPSDRSTAGDISDGDLYGLLAELTRNTKNVILILDACYSGAPTRAVDLSLRTKEIPPALVSKPGASDPTRARSGTAPSRLGFFPPNGNYVAVYSSLRYQKSNEQNDLPAEGGGTKPFGVFTYYFVKVLQQNPNLTYGEAAEKVGDFVDRRYGQSPVAEASIERPVFGGSGQTADPYLRITSGRITGKTFTIEGGAMLGLQQGGFLAIYAPTARKLVGDTDKLANARIGQVRPTDATAELMAMPNKPIPGDARVALIAPNFGTQKVRLLLPTPRPGSSAEEKTFLDTIKARLTDDPLVAWVSAGAPPPNLWDVSVQRGCWSGQSTETAATLDPQTARCSESQKTVYCVMTAGQSTPLFGFWTEPTPKGTEDLVIAVESYAKQANLRALANDVSPLKGQVKLRLLKVEPETGPDGQPRIGKVTPFPAGSTVLMHTGDFFQIEIENKSDQNLDFAILSLETDGGVKLLTTRGVGHEVQHDKTYRTPLVYVLNPPEGLGTYKVIAYSHGSNDEERSPDFGLLQLPGVPKGITGRNLADPLSWLVSTAAIGARTEAAFSTVPSSWTVAQVDVSQVK